MTPRLEEQAFTEEDRRQRAELIARQGKGARHDSDNAPHGDLLLARRGTAYFARLLNDLSDSDLRGETRVQGWTRGHLVARVSYQARSLSRLMEAVRTGAGHAAYPLQVARDPETELGASLPARALRHLFHHSAVHLDVEWRDLPGPCWDRRVVAPGGEEISARDIPRLRAIGIWNAGLEIGNGGRRSDIPPAIMGTGRVEHPRTDSRSQR